MKDELEVNERVQHAKYQEIEIELGKLSVDEKKLDLQKKQHEIRFNEHHLNQLDRSYENERRIIDLDEQRALIDKIAELRNLLSAEVVETGNKFGTEQTYSPILYDEDRDIIREKILQLIKKL